MQTKSEVDLFGEDTTSMRHLSNEDLADYSIEPTLLGERREAAEEHLRQCVDCAATLKVLHDVDSRLRQEEPWLTVDERSSDALRQPRELALRGVAKKVEDAAAARLLRRPLASPTAFAWWMSRLIARPKFHTGGVVRLLCNVARSACESKPLHAKNLADVAIVIAQQLSRPEYSDTLQSELRGRAWKERANALRVLGGTREALDALDRSEKEYRGVADPDLPIASVNYVRAMVLRQLEQYDQALALLRGSSHTFLHFGEKERYIASRYIAGSIYFFQRELGRAESVANDVLAYAKERGNETWRARALLILGHVHVMRRSYRSALEYATEAGTSFRKSGLEIEALRADSACALARIGLSDFRRGLYELRRVREGFVDNAMASDVALVTIDMIEALREADERQEAIVLAKDLVARLPHIGAQAPAIDAANYLLKVTAAEILPTSLLRNLRQFFERLAVRPDLAFSPPT
jgi:tetratricopeptide (TPR) repeat protein